MNFIRDIQIAINFHATEIWKIFVEQLSQLLQQLTKLRLSDFVAVENANYFIALFLRTKTNVLRFGSESHDEPFRIIRIDYKTSAVTLWNHIVHVLSLLVGHPLRQLIVCLSKMIIFISKRETIAELIKEIHRVNYEATNDEMVIVRRENAKDNFLCTLFFRLVIFTGGWAVLHPAIYGLYVYFSTGEVVLTEGFRATYFWNHSNFIGYSVLYMLNISTAYYCCCVSVAFDTLFYWFVSNIVAQFHITGHRFDQLGVQQQAKLLFKSYEQKFYSNTISCIQYQRQALDLAEKLNTAYEQIVFIKFVVVCSEICSLIFQISRPNDSLAEMAYKVCFLSAITLQLMLYCWNGQRIKDESERVSTAIYCAVDWSSLQKSNTKLLLISMLRSQRCSCVTGVFFEVNLSLFLWVFKTAGSLLTALKTMDENQA